MVLIGFSKIERALVNIPTVAPNVYHWATSYSKVRQLLAQKCLTIKPCPATIDDLIALVGEGWGEEGKLTSN